MVGFLRFGFGLRAAIAACFLVAAAAAATAQPSAEDFGRLPAHSDAAISPDGARVAVSWAENDGVGYAVIDIETGQLVLVKRIAPTTNLLSVGWIDDERLLLTMSATVTNRSLPYGYRLRGRQGMAEYYRSAIHRLSDAEPIIVDVSPDLSWAFTDTSRLIAPLEGAPDRGAVLMSFGGYAMVVLVDLSTGRLVEDRSRGRPRVQAFGDYALGPDGRPAVRMVFDARTETWALRFGESENNVGGGPIGDRAPDLVGQLPDGRAVLLIWPPNEDRMVMQAVDAAGVAETIAASPRYDIEGPVYDPWTRAVVGAVWTEDYPRQRFFDAQLAELAQALDGNFQSGFAQVLSWSRDRSRLAVYGERADDGGAFYVLEPATRQLMMVGRRYEQLPGEWLGVRQAVTYPARDGTPIPAYLTLPPNARQATNLPLVLLVHGGPHARDAFVFDWIASFLATRGYAVLQPNFRGSTGFGRAWTDAGRGGWGDGIMQTDVEDGVDALARAGRIDPSRVCIMGLSYGGYAALAGAAFTPQRYACAISVAGVSDVADLVRETRRVTGVGAEGWGLDGENRRMERARLRAISPLTHVDAITAPVLLLHGTEDTVVPIRHSQRIERRLRDAGKDVQLVQLPNDDHWLSYSATRIRLLQEVEAFLSRVLQAAPAAPDPQPAPNLP